MWLQIGLLVAKEIIDFLIRKNPRLDSQSTVGLVGRALTRKKL